MAEPTITFDPTQMQRANWVAIWNGVNLGLANAIEPDIKLMMDGITAGTLGKAKLGDRFVGLEGTIKLELLQTTLNLFSVLLPWNEPTGNGTFTAPLTLTPPINTDLYDYAQTLILHPSNLAIATTTDDLFLAFAVPTSIMELKRDGKSDDMLKVEFQFYPDRTQLVTIPPVLYYGGIGAVPEGE